MRKSAISPVLRLSLYGLALTVACFLVDGSRAQAPVDPPQDGSVLNEMSGSGNLAEPTKKFAPIKERSPPRWSSIYDHWPSAQYRALEDFAYYESLGEFGRELALKYGEKFLSSVEEAVEAQQNEIDFYYERNVETTKRTLDAWEDTCVEKRDMWALTYMVNLRDKTEEVLKALQSRDKAKEIYQREKDAHDLRVKILKNMKNMEDNISKQVEGYRYDWSRFADRRAELISKRLEKEAEYERKQKEFERKIAENLAERQNSEQSQANADVQTPQSAAEPPAGLGGLPPVGFQAAPPSGGRYPDGTANYGRLLTDDTRELGRHTVSSGSEQESSTDDDDSILNEFGGETGILRLSAPREAKVMATDRVAGASAAGASGAGCD